MSQVSDVLPLFDSSSVIDIIALFRHPIKKPPYEWAGRNAIIITSFLIQHPTLKLRVAGGPTKAVRIQEPFELILREKFIEQVGLANSDVREAAQKQIKEWVKDENNRVRLNAILTASKADPIFLKWISHEPEFRWKSYYKQINGLWDPDYDGLMALIRGGDYTESTVRMLRIDSERHLNEFIKRAAKDPQNKGIEVYVDFYILAAMLRGEFHNLVADSVGAGVYHHHFRLVARQKEVPSPSDAKRWRPSLVAQFLGAHVIAAASEFRVEEQRIHAWIDGVKKVREYLLSNPVALQAVEDVENIYEGPAEEQAAKIAQDCDLPSRYGVYKHNAERFGTVLHALGLVSTAAGAWALVATGAHLLGILGEAGAAVLGTAPLIVNRVVPVLQERRLKEVKGLGTYFDDWTGERLITPAG